MGRLQHAPFGRCGRRSTNSSIIMRYCPDYNLYVVRMDLLDGYYRLL
jgi:hypothetical protein